MLSVWVLYSMMVLGGRLRTRRRVSLMRAVVAWSLAVLFQMEMMSSWRREAEMACLSVLKEAACFEVKNRCGSVCEFYLEAYWHHSPADLLSYHELLPKHGQDQVLPAPGCQTFPKPNDPLPTHLIGIVLNTTQARFQNNSIKKIKCITKQVPTSHMGLIPSLKRWKSLWPVRSPGRIMWL